MSGTGEDELDGRVLALGLLEAAPDAILIVRPGGVIAMANRMAERMFGYDRADLVGRPVEMLIPAAKREGHAVVRERYEHAPRTRHMGELTQLDAVRKNGDLLPVEVSLSPVETTAGRLVIAIVRDVSQRRELENQLRNASTHDALTGLFNRTYLEEVRARLETDFFPVGVVMLDVDGLKAANDRLGHEAGDKLLKRVSVVLRSTAGPDDVPVRLGGDEFALFVARADAESLERTVSCLRAELTRHNEVHRGEPLEFSLGVALAERRGGVANAMRLADVRMYENKRNRAKLRGH